MIRWQASGDGPLIGRLSGVGLVLGALAFAASLTPSMIPREGAMQGLLGGLCFGVGYLIGDALVTLWVWMLERPAPSARAQRRGMRLACLLSVAVSGWALSQVTGWQNGIHLAMGMPPVETARPFTILAVAVVVAAILLLIGRLFRRLRRVIAAQLRPFLPPRVALMIAIAVTALVFWSIGSDLVAGRVLAALDQTYAAIDELVPADQPPPTDPLKSGSAASVTGWEGLGAMGRDWVLDPTDAAAIGAMTGASAQDPLRIYVGLNSAETPEARAALALREALRVGAFERAVLVIGTPTGTGWMDPAGMRPLEYLTGGDVASIGVQYSYLPSWLSLFLQPEYGSDTARAVFNAIYGHWRTLPANTRPRLYLFGLSLGARNGGLSVSLPDLLGDPFHGALWVGPPFAAQGWRSADAGWQVDAPAWAPRFRDGAVIRVATQDNALLDQAEKPWGPVRMVYLQYPSDPIVFFSPAVLWRAPDWMQVPRGPDISAGLRWIPVVTFLQMGFDMMTATTTPVGHGHVYAGRDYSSAWAAVLASDWPAARLQALRDHLTAQGL